MHGAHNVRFDFIGFHLNQVGCRRDSSKLLATFLILVCFLLGNFPASEFNMPTFRNTLFHLHRRIGVEWLCYTYQPLASMWIIALHYLLCNRTHPYPVTHLSTGSGHFRAKPFLPTNTLHFLNIVILHLSAHEDGTECSETSAYNIQTPGNYPEESIQFQFISNKMQLYTVYLYLETSIHVLFSYYEDGTDRVFRNVGI